MQTITFSEQLFGSFDPIYKCKIETISFHGQIVNDGAQVTSPVIAHDTSYMGPVSWTFSRPADHVEFDAGYFNDVSSTTVKFFDKDGNLLKRFENTVGDGFQHFVYNSDKGIARVVVNNDKTDQAGFAVDNMAFSIKLPEVDLTDTDDINGLLWGWKWEHKNLTYSFPTSSDEYTKNGYQQVVNFEALNDAQKTAYAGIIGNFGDVCGLSFTAAAGENADIRFGECDQIDYSDGRGLHKPAGASNTAEGNPPDPRRAVVGMGDVWFNHNNYNAPDVGSFAYAAGLMHELGHSLGLKHGHVSQNGHGVTFPQLPENHNSYEYSVMTYHQYVGDTTPGDNAPDHPTSLMQDDIAALQYLYGADFNANKGDTTYTWDEGSQMLINGVGQGTPKNGHALLTIWDGGGTDTYDFSNKTDDLVVNLAPGAWTTFGALANLGSNHMARGNVANALLYKGNDASLIENATGGSGKDKLLGNDAANTFIGNGGNDRMNGGKGNDTMTGNDGSDTFMFSTALNKNTNLDRILDYNAADDSFLLDRKVFKGLTGNVLSEDAFVQGGGAQDAEDRIIYNDVNGSVLFDADGKGGIAAVKFAQINAGLLLSNADFLLAG